MNNRILYRGATSLILMLMTVSMGVGLEIAEGGGGLSTDQSTVNSTGESTTSQTGLAAVGDWQLEQLEQEAFKRAADRVAPSIVRIETIGGLDGIERADGEVVQHAVTSGVVVGEEGWIVSSAFNFVQQPSSILVTLPGGPRVAAKVVAKDLSRMIVLLKVAPPAPLPVPAMAPVAEISVGAWGITVARSLSEASINITSGIISAKRRIWGKAIQTDANVSPANYGGVLVDIQGRAIGVLVPLSPEATDVVAGAEWYDSGIGFAVPLENLLHDLARLRQGDLLPGKLGISLKGSDIYGLAAEIAVCQPNSPAREAGIIAGDQIVEANGVPIATQADLKYVLGPLYAGDRINFVLTRNEARVEASVVLVDKLVPYAHPFLGLLPRRTEENDSSAAGVEVHELFADSPAAKAGLRVGDRVVQCGDDEVKKRDDLFRALAAYEPGDTVQLKVLRGTSVLDIEGKSDAETDRDEKPATPETETLSLTLGRLAAELPTTPLPPVSSGKDTAEPLPALGKIEVKLPEEEGNCHAYVPETYELDSPHALLVWLPEPGKVDVDQWIGSWKSVCDKYRILLLLPQAKDARGWLPTETAFLRKTIENMTKRYQIDPHRIAVGGIANSGSMAYLFAFKERDLIRGVAVLDGPIPRRAPSIFNEPLQRLFFYIAATKETPLKKRVGEEVKVLREAMFPVFTPSELEKPEFDLSAREELMRWLDSLDRM